MRIIDTTPQMVALVRATGGVFDREAWRAYAAGISPQLPAKLEEDSASYDFGRQILPVLNAAWRDPAGLELAHQSFAGATRGLGRRVRQLFGAEPQVDVVFYMGLCNGAGWATSLGGRPAVLLGAEKILELGWQGEAEMKALLYHELGHVLHDTLRSVPRAGDENPAVWQLYSEGFAMVAEQALLGDPGYFHQGDAAWLAWCGANAAEALAEYKRRVAAGDSVQDFFGDWCSYQGHHDVGYYLGCGFVRALLRESSLQAVANLESEALAGAFIAYEG